MKILATLLLISCAIDIVFPAIKAIKGIRLAKENNIPIDKRLLNKILISELLNFIASTFFIVFLIKY